MIKNTLFLFLLIFTFSCSNSKFTKVNWQGDLIKKTNELNYLYWSDGVQFLTQHKDSLTISMAGFSHDNIIYILVSMSNETKGPITYIPKKSKIQYQSEIDSIELEPVKPKNLDTDHFSFFNTILVGAGNISRLFINLPVDMLLKSDNKEPDALSNIDEEYHDEGIKITKKIFISNHTVFPETHYAGFLVFEYDDDKPITNKQFTMKIIFDDEEFSGVGSLSD